MKKIVNLGPSSTLQLAIVCPREKHLFVIRKRFLCIVPPPCFLPSYYYLSAYGMVPTVHRSTAPEWYRKVRNRLLEHHQFTPWSTTTSDGFWQGNTYARLKISLTYRSWETHRHNVHHFLLQRKDSIKVGIVEFVFPFSQHAHCKRRNLACCGRKKMQWKGGDAVKRTPSGKWSIWFHSYNRLTVHDWDYMPLCR